MARCAGCSSDLTICGCILEAGNNLTLEGSGTSDDPWILDASFPVTPENGMPFTILGDGGGSLVAVTPGVLYTPVWDFTFNGPPGTEFVGPGGTEIVINGSNQIIAAPSGAWSDGSSGRRWFLFYFRIQSFNWTSPWSAGQYVALSLAGTDRWQAWIHHAQNNQFYGTFVQGVFPGTDLTPTLLTLGGLALSTSGWSLTVFKMAKG